MVYVVVKSIIYKSDTNGTVWNKDYVLFDDGIDRPNLGLTASLADQTGKTVLIVLNAGRDVWFDGTWHDSNAVKKCVCDIKLIMCKGCQCGGV